MGFALIEAVRPACPDLHIDDAACLISLIQLKHEVQKLEREYPANINKDTAFGQKYDLLCIMCLQIAAVFEFAGALVLGRVVTNTIAGGIADINAFVRTPEIYAYGMVCALFVGGIFQLIASFLELNVSATHSISEPLPSIKTVFQESF